jgi:uncharacterized protein YyaL (SSP411 family)
VSASAPRLFALGACPGILYQHTGGGGTQLKTLETGANYIKAALLLYQITHHRGYLAQAEDQYQAVRRYFLSPDVPLYTVYLFDTGSSCQQVPAQYYGSVNGTMIWAGLDLAGLTGAAAYRTEAIATAKAVGHLVLPHDRVLPGQVRRLRVRPARSGDRPPRSGDRAPWSGAGFQPMCG